MHYLIRHPQRRLVLAFGAKGASQSLRRWFTDTLENSTVKAGKVGEFVVSAAVIPSLEDHHKVLVLREPLRRLVSFYLHYVVADPRTWCFADAALRFKLEGKSFRELLFVLAHLHRHDLAFQHHLEPQKLKIEGLCFDEVLTVERLEEGIDGLNARFGFSAKIERRNARRYDSSNRELAADRPAQWFRNQGVPAWESFYDEEARALAQEIYADDLALYRRATAKSADESSFSGGGPAADLKREVNP